MPKQAVRKRNIRHAEPATAPHLDRCSVVREDPFTSDAALQAAPFAGEIRAGKNTYVYDAHTYHTKVPPEGIARDGLALAKSKKSTRTKNSPANYSSRSLHFTNA